MIGGFSSSRGEEDSSWGGSWGFAECLEFGADFHPEGGIELGGFRRGGVVWGGRRRLGLHAATTGGSPPNWVFELFRLDVVIKFLERSTKMKKIEGKL